MNMDPPLASLMHDWHDFYALVGTASATLVGLMFVAASIGANVFNKDHHEPMKAFVTPTVVHFSAVLLISIVLTVPTQTFASLAAVLGCGGIAGLAYSGRQWLRVRSVADKIDLEDRLFYGLIPVAGHLLIGVAAWALYARSPSSPELIAVALIVLLVAGIRNAWDMTVWIVTRSPRRS